MYRSVVNVSFRWILGPWAVAAALAFIALPRLAAGAVVATLAGQAFEGEVEAWDGDRLTLRTAGGSQQLAAAELLDIRWDRTPAEAPAALSVEFTDGTRTSYAEFTAVGQALTFTGSRFDAAEPLSRALLRQVELQARTPATSAMLDEISKKELAGDALVVVKRDGQSLDYLSGVVGDVTAEQVMFEWDGERVAVKRAKIAAIIFYQGKAPALPEPRCRLTLTDGSRISVRDVALDEGRLAVTTPAGVRLTLEQDEVERADFSAGKLAYLSDLKPASVVWTPQVALPPSAETLARHGEPRVDQAFTGSPLTLLWKDDVARSRRDVRTYGKGLAVRSRTELSYLVPEGMQRFAALAGIDPETAAQGRVHLQIRGDERLLWEGDVAGGKPPQQIELDLAAARRLHLLVDYGENLDYGDRLHLVEARFTK